MANKIITLHNVSQPLTPKREAFTQVYVETGNASEAHRRAGYGPNMSAKTRNEAASRLLADSKVQARVIELQDHHQQRHDITVDDLIAEYDENRTLALRISQPAAANGATAGKARLCGLDRGEGKVEVNVNQTQGKVSDIEVARRLAFILAQGAHAAEEMNDEAARDQIQAALNTR